MSSLEDRGCTYTEKVNPFVVSFMAIMIDNTPLLQNSLGLQSQGGKGEERQVARLCDLFFPRPLLDDHFF
jgi:hypothetical protein